MVRTEEDNFVEDNLAEDSLVEDSPAEDILAEDRVVPEVDKRPSVVPLADDLFRSIDSRTTKISKSQSDLTTLQIKIC